MYNHFKNHIVAFIGIWQGFFLPFIKDLTTFFQFGSAAIGFSIGVYTIFKMFKSKTNDRNTKK